ncbi:cytochrome c biogenesis protein CcmG, thiol:disulfide interchange protein DsbE [Acidiphilium sp. MT5]|jgi:cytochrome c biogenesis protein CcmG/thiol:disulfide interchange protein DsbE
MDRSLLSRRLLLAAPLGLAVAGGVGAYALIERAKRGTYNPQDFNNPLVGHRVPGFALDGLPGHQGFDQADLLAIRRPVLVNFFASWCVPCVQEAPFLDGLAKAGLDIWGIAYQDKPEAAALYLAAHGNPYRRLAMDPTGRTAINWGVYGVPESFLIAPGGMVRWHAASPLFPDVIDTQLEPALRKIT